MIPIRDTIRSYTFPIVNWLLIGLNLLVFLYEAMLSPARLNHLIATYGLVPAHLHLNDAQWVLTHPLVLATIFTSMFLHGGWFHVISTLFSISLLNLPDAINAGSVAWWAHIGEFVFGLVFYRFLLPGSTRRFLASTRMNIIPGKR